MPLQKNMLLDPSKCKTQSSESKPHYIVYFKSITFNNFYHLCSLQIVLFYLAVFTFELFHNNHVHAFYNRLLGMGFSNC